MDLKARLSELARWQPCPTPVVSVYLDTEWTDEQQRERVRIFLKNALRDARERALAAPADLDWIERQGRAVIDREVLEAANGAALFACEAAGLREMVPVRMPFEPTFVVESTPFLRPLAGLPDDTPASLVVFVNGTTARLIPLNTTGPESEAVLEAQVEGRHSMGGWAALAQSRYQRHIEMHREQHFEATAAAVTSWSDRRGAERIVLAGEPRTVAALRRHLPDRVSARVVGTVTGMRWEAPSVIAKRAAERLREVDEHAEEEAVDGVLVDAAKGAQAVAGVHATLEALNRGAVLRLYILEAFREPGVTCGTCGAVVRGVHFRCP